MRCKVTYLYLKKKGKYPNFLQTQRAEGWITVYCRMLLSGERNAVSCKMKQCFLAFKMPLLVFFCPAPPQTASCFLHIRVLEGMNRGFFPSLIIMVLCTGARTTPFDFLTISSVRYRLVFFCLYCKNILTRCFFLLFSLYAGIPFLLILAGETKRDMWAEGWRRKIVNIETSESLIASMFQKCGLWVGKQQIYVLT